MQPAESWQSAWDGHLVLAYDGEQARRAGVVAWVRRGFALGATVVNIEHPGYPTVRFSGEASTALTARSVLAHLDGERAADTLLLDLERADGFILEGA